MKSSPDLDAETKPVVNSSAGMHRPISKSAELAGLADGWDSYRAPAPNSAAIENTRTFLRQADTLGLAVERVESSAMGGVGATFSRGDLEAVVEFYNNGTAHALFTDERTGQMQTRPVPINESGYDVVISEIRDFLNGK
jgi:hypothetical protein